MQKVHNNGPDSVLFAEEGPTEAMVGRTKVIESLGIILSVSVFKEMFLKEVILMHPFVNLGNIVWYVLIIDSQSQTGKVK